MKFGRPNLCLVSFVIVQNGIRGPRQAFAIVDVWIRVHRHHLGPLIEIFLLFRRELVLIVLRLAVKITNASENECGLCRRSSGAQLLRIQCAAGDSR